MPSRGIQGVLFAGAERDVEQAEAIRAPLEKHLCILAGPGAGKTHVLVSRIAHLVAEGIPPGRIAAVTYTNSARDELRSRLRQALGGGEVFVGTIHQLAACFLRSGRERPGRIGVLDPEQAARLFSAWGRPAEAFETHCLAVERWDGRGSPPAALAVLEEFDRELRRRSLASFQSLQLWALEQIERGLVETPAHILVDEFQDTSGLQVRLLEALVSRQSLVTVVGDPEQAVFQFAGADPGQLGLFPDRFAPCTTSVLSANARSTRALVQVVGRLRTRLPQFALRERGERPELLYLRGEPQQAEQVADLVTGLLGQGASPADMAVLAREGQSKAIVEALEGRGVPVWLSRGERSRPHLSNLALCLEALAEPEDECAQFLLFDGVIRGGLRTWAEVQAAHRPPEPIAAAVLRVLDSVPRPRRAALQAYLDAKACLAEIADLDPAAQVRTIHARLLATRFSLRERTLAPLIAADIDRLADLARDLREPLALAEAIRQGLLPAEHAGERLTIATLHFAKGREWPIVFLVDLTLGVLPHRLSTDRAEERRLFHVGLSRARDRLYLLAPERLPGRGEGFCPYLAELADLCRIADLR